MASKDTELFSPDLVFFDMEAESTDEFFTKLGAELKKRGNINDGWYDGISTREKNYPFTPRLLLLPFLTLILSSSRSPISR